MIGLDKLIFYIFNSIMVLLPLPFQSSSKKSGYSYKHPYLLNDWLKGI